MGKGKKYGLFVSLFFCIFLCFSMTTVEAKSKISKIHIRDAQVKEDFGFDKDGNFKMVVRDKIATGTTTYRTLGWTIKRYDAPIAGNESIRMKLISSGDPVVDPTDSEYEYHYFVCPKDLIFSKIEQCSEEWLHDLYENGGYVYLDAIMTVAESGISLGSLFPDGTTQGEVYFTYDGIAGARKWLDPDALKTHYNKKVYFPPNEKMLYGTYEVHYMELPEKSSEYEEAIPLYYLGLDLEKKDLKNVKQEFEPGDTGEEDLVYVKTRILYQKYQKNEKSSEKKGKFTIDNTKFTYKYLKIYHYYIRKEHIEEKEIQYGMDLIRENTLKISAEKKGNPKFDVEQGIPATEQLRIDGKVQKFSYDLVYQNHSGSMMVPVKVTIQYSVSIPEQGVVTVKEDKTCYVKRNYSYYTIKKAKTDYANYLIVENYSFPEGKVKLYSLYEPQIVLEQERNKYLFLPNASITINGGFLGEEKSSVISNEEIQREAEKACGKIQVINDSFQIDQDVIMKKGAFEEEAEEPVVLKGRRDLDIEEGAIRILDTKQNGEWKSKAGIYYQRFGEVKETAYKIKPVNKVVIHTPVICKAGSSDEIAFNQQIVPTKYHSLILGREFRVAVSLFGRHLDLPGYGERDYSKYVKRCQVRFPFEVYDKEQHIEKDQWISMEIARLSSQSFYLPIGVEEGDYSIQFRTLAINYESISNGSDQVQAEANCSIENYGATDQFHVTVVGRMYGLELTDIYDHPRWTSVFYQSGGAVSTGKTYRIGKNNCNGEQIQGIGEKDVFPVLYGSHPNNILAGPVRLGYQVKLRLKTIGSLYGEEDKIVIKPSYYYVDEQAQNRQQVDIYTKKDLKKIQQMLILGKTHRAFQTIKDRNVFGEERQKNSLQIWEGTYHLSADTLIVPHGTDLKKYVQGKGGRIRPSDSIFLKKGYLVVQFMIRSVTNGELHLDYVNAQNHVEGYCNMWKTEGFFYQRVDNRGVAWEFTDGDFLVYDRNRTIYDDYEVVGTH